MSNKLGENKEMEKVLKALANKRRLAIIRFLKQNRQAPVWQISAGIKLSFRSTSRHLAILSVIDILDKEQRGPEIYYQISKNQNPIVESVIKNI